MLVILSQIPFSVLQNSFLPLFKLHWLCCHFLLHLHLHLLILLYILQQCYAFTLEIYGIFSTFYLLLPQCQSVCFNSNHVPLTRKIFSLLFSLLFSLRVASTLSYIWGVRRTFSGCMVILNSFFPYLSCHLLLEYHVNETFASCLLPFSLLAFCYLRMHVDTDWNGMEWKWDARLSNTELFNLYTLLQIDFYHLSVTNNQWQFML